MADVSERMARVAAGLIGRALSARQRAGIAFLCARWARDYPCGEPQWFAYILATVQHETWHTFEPIEEVGRGRGKPYAPRYFGRGYCQLTWLENYHRFGRLLGVDLVNHPERALEPEIAATILFRGMVEGLYTGVGLGRFLSATRTDFVGARRVVNGTDRAARIAAMAVAYRHALADTAQAGACTERAPSSSSAAVSQPTRRSNSSGSSDAAAAPSAPSSRPAARAS